MATTLPSFVQLMASLGLDQATPTTTLTSPRASPRLSSSRDPSPSIPRSRSSSSLKDVPSARTRSARYTPYSPKQLSTTRRASLSSVSSSSSASDTSSRSQSSSPRLPAFPRSKNRSHQLTINVCESSNDLSANTPISSYVRRKTPGTSPTSTAFPRDFRDDTPSCLTPLSLPTLPPLPPLSGSSDEFPITPESYSFLDDEPDVATDTGLKSRPRRRCPMGTRLSTSPFPGKISHRARRRYIDHAE